MQRSIVLALILLLGALAGAAWWFLGISTPPPTPPGAPDAAPVDPTAPEAATGHGPGGDPGIRAAREAVGGGAAAVLDDPEIRAGLCGFKGRVVNHQKVPVGDCGVRIYRGALDSVLPADFDLFAPESTYVPDYIAGETRTAADGTWQLTGVWPRAFYLLYAGLGTDCPMHQVVTRTPSPGEIVDLGDIVLPDAGVIVGTVHDDNGDPLPGALVRAADLPGTLAAFFPVERFDPEGALLVREQGFPQRVIVMPPWVKSAFEHLPIPSTRTDAEGRFRLVGVVPGSNLLATTAPGFLSDVKPSVQVRAGQEKDVGKVRLKRGEELLGKVVDGAGKPVADAEVLAGSTLSMAPVDLAQKLGRTDAEGRFTGQGFAAGKVTVAARRGKGHTWVLAEPQSILGDVVVTLPTTFAADVTITLADGKPATAARLQLLQGRAGNGAAEMFLLGISPPIDLRDRSKAVAEGRWRLENLAAGSYTLVADAPGHATAFATFDLTAADATVALALTAPQAFAVRVLDPRDEPVRNAAIYAQGSGRKGIDMPVKCGRTGADGRLGIDKLQADSLRVSADHPKWGVVHGEAKLGQELVLRLQEPGALQGVLREHGKPPEPGKFTIALERRGGGGPRGPLETTPQLLTPGLDGTFAATVLQPGTYQVHTLKALDALRSPGGIFTMAQEMFLANDLPEEQVQIVGGQTAQVVLEAGEKPLEGPTARLSGSLTIDGRLGTGHVLSVNGNNRRATARVDERGRFDFGLVPAGDLWVEVMASSDGMFLGPNNDLWSSRLKLAEGEARELAIELLTSSISGVCVDLAGQPVAGVNVRAQGQLKGTEGNQVSLNQPTNEKGEFRFDKVAEGKWSLNVRSRRGGSSRAQIEAFEVQGGVPVTGLRLQLQPAVVVKGRVDMAAFAANKPEWAWVSAHRLRDEDPPDAQGSWANGFGIDTTTGAFSTEELAPGRYRLRLHAQAGEGENAEYALDGITVPPAGLADVQLRPGARIVR